MKGSIKTAAEMLAEMRAIKHADLILFNAFTAQAIYGWSDEEAATVLAYHAMKCLRAAQRSSGELAILSDPNPIK